MVISTLKTTVHEIGWAGGLCYGFDRILRKMGLGRVYFYGLYAQSLDDFPPMPHGYTVCVLEDPVIKASKLGLPLTVVQQRLNEGAVVIAAFHEDELVGSLFLALSPFEEDEVDARFNWVPLESGCWDYGVYVMPKWRLGRAFAALWSGSAHIMKERGIGWSYSRISLYNRSSDLSHQRLGAVQLGKAVFFVFGRLQISIATIKPWLKLSWGGKGRPEFTLKNP